MRVLNLLRAVVDSFTQNELSMDVLYRGKMLLHRAEVIVAVASAHETYTLPPPWLEFPLVQLLKVAKEMEKSAVLSVAFT